MKHPWLKFYTSDWRSDPALRMCSMAARGLWVELICIMHEAEPYGHLFVNGIALTPTQLASLTGCSVKECNQLVANLESAGVLSRTENGVIFSRRMVRDREKSLKDKENGAEGGNPKLAGGVNPPVNPGVKAQNPEPRIQIPESKKEASPPNGHSGSKKGKPAHGRRTKDGRRLWLDHGTVEWNDYAKDYRDAHSGVDPPLQWNGGGTWFNLAGEH